MFALQCISMTIFHRRGHRYSSEQEKTMTNTTIHKIIKFYNFFNKCKIALKFRKKQFGTVQNSNEQWRTGTNTSVKNGKSCEHTIRRLLSVQRKKFCGHTVWSHFLCAESAGVWRWFLWSLSKFSKRSQSDLIFSRKNASQVFVSQNFDINFFFATWCVDF